MGLLPHVCFFSVIVFTPFFRVDREQNYSGGIVFYLAIFFQPSATSTESVSAAENSVPGR
jgi:hypothetical protein